MKKSVQLVSLKKVNVIIWLIGELFPYKTVAKINCTWPSVGAFAQFKSFNSQFNGTIYIFPFHTGIFALKAKWFIFPAFSLSLY